MPTIGTSDEVLSGTYLFIMIVKYDPSPLRYLLAQTRRPRCVSCHSLVFNAHFDNKSSPGSIAGLAAGTRTTLLHAMITGFKSSGTTKNTAHVLSSTDTAPASYMAPGPPAETPPHPHKYVQLPFPQPASFAVPASMKSVISSRVGFDINKFITAASLDAPLRANWFTVTR